MEEIRLRKPDAKIVINSLLPMVDFQDNGEVKMADFADFEGKDESKGEKYRKREVPSTFKVGGGNDDDEAGEEKRGERPKPKDGKGRKLKAHSQQRDTKERPPRPPRAPKQTKKEREREEDNATEGPELDRAIERRKKILEAKDKRVRDKVFRDNEKFHPKKPVNPLLPMIKKRVLPPVWPAVHLINDKLKEFCMKHESITFFDATPIFATSESGGKHHLYTELISTRGHPSEQGFLRWEGAILSRLNQLLKPPKSEVDSVGAVPSEMRSGGVVVKESVDGSEHVSAGKESEPPRVGNDYMPDRHDPKPADDDEAADDDYEE